MKLTEKQVEWLAEQFEYMQITCPACHNREMVIDDHFFEITEYELERNTDFVIYELLSRIANLETQLDSINKEKEISEEEKIMYPVPKITTPQEYGLKPKQHLPLMMGKCSVCGFVMFFDAMQIGLIKPPGSEEKKGFFKRIFKRRREKK